MYQRFDALFPLPPPPLSRWGLRLSPLMASLGPYIIDLQTRIGWRNFCVYFTTAPTVHEICQIYPWQEFNYWLSPNKVLRAPLVLEMMYSEANWLYWSPVGSGLSPSLSGLETNTKWQLGTIFSPIMRFSHKRVITITAILALQRGLPATSAFIKIFSECRNTSSVRFYWIPCCFDDRFCAKFSHCL